RTDGIIPLEITPQPVELKRTLVIRVELLTPADEAELADRLRSNDAAYFMAKGRFAEPHLSRALQLMTGVNDPYSTDGQAYAWGPQQLEIIRAKRRWAPLSAE